MNPTNVTTKIFPSTKASPECSTHQQLLFTSTREHSSSIHVTETRHQPRNATVRITILLTMVCFSTLMISAADARIFYIRSKNSDKSIADSAVNPTESSSSTRPCKIYLNQPLHAIMDRVCVICHEMFSHERPNMRAECRSNCFRSEHFRKCLDMFRPNQEAQVLLKGSSS